LKEIFSFDKTEGVRHWKEILSLGNENHLAEIKTISNKITYEGPCSYYLHFRHYRKT